MKILKGKTKRIKAIPLPKDTFVEHYKILNVIGTGGFSVVYSALDTNTNKIVAIKEFYATNCMRRSVNNDLHIYPADMHRKYNNGLKRFFDEGLTISKIKHPNIVNVSNFFRANNSAYLVMDFEHGKDFRWFIKTKSFVTDEKFIFQVFSKLLSGLDALHEKNILHLDIKPSNILMRTNGSPLIIDLGASYPIDKQKGRRLHTLTHGYSSPEQHNKTVLDFSTDLYSVAMTMRACITHKSPPSAVKRLKKDALKPLSKSHSKHYSKSLISAIDQASDLDPARRPQSVNELIELMLGR